MKGTLPMRNSLNRILLASALALGVAASAHALPILRLTTSGGSMVTVADGGAGDIDPTAGSVVVFGPLAGWNINVSTGLSTPVLGSASQPELDLNSVNVSSGAGWIDIELTDTGFTAQNAASFLATIGGTTSGSVSYRTYLDSSNTAFGQGTLLTSFNSVGTPFANAASNVLTSATLYSLTLLVRITHTGQGQASSFDATVKVPEPGTLLLLGAGCLALAPFTRRRGLQPAKVA
jgi:hypothetical protein